MKKSYLSIILCHLFLLLNSVPGLSQVDPYIKGPGIDLGTVATTDELVDYEINYADGKSMPVGFVALVKWTVEGGEVIHRHPEKPLVTIKWKKGTQKGIITTKDVFRYTIQPSYDYTVLSFSVVCKDKQTQPEPEPPTEWNPKFALVGDIYQYQRYTINLDVDKGRINKINEIVWNIEGKTFTMTNPTEYNTVFSFLNAGKTTIKAKITGKRGYTTVSKEIQTEVNVIIKAPYIDHIIGDTRIGVRGTSNYSPSPEFKSPNIEYTWTITPKKNIVIESQANDLTVRFTAAGYHVITCSVKDTKTGLTGNQASIRVTASDDFPLFLNTNKNESPSTPSKISNLTPIDYQGHIYLEVYNTKTGILVKKETIDKDDDIHAKVVTLPKGLYILKIKTEKELIYTEKISIK